MLKNGYSPKMGWKHARPFMFSLPNVDKFYSVCAFERLVKTCCLLD